MRPVLIYESSETAFTSNGLGGLFPSSCTVTESINGEFSLSMSHPRDELGKWEKLAVGRVIKAWTYRGYQLFRVYKIDKPIFEQIPVYANHIFYDLLDNFILDTRPSATTAVLAGQAILSGCAEATNFTFTSDIAGIATAYYVRTNPVAAFIGDDDQSMINRWGGEIVRDNFGAAINNQIGANNGVVIAYRKNLTGLTMTEDISASYSDICPTALDKEGGVLKLPEVYVTSTHTLPKKRYTTTHFSDIKVGATVEGVIPYPDTATAYIEMRARCNAMFTAGLNRPAVTLECSFASLDGVDGYSQFAALSAVGLGDTVTVKHEPMNVDLSLRVITVNWNVLTECYSEVTIGDRKPNLGKTVTGIDASIANLDQSMSGVIMQGEEYNNVYINYQDGFVCESTVGGKAIRISMNATDGLSITADGVKVMGVDSNGHLYATRFADPDDPSRFAQLGLIDGTGIAESMTFYQPVTGPGGTPRKRLSIGMSGTVATLIEAIVKTATGDVDGASIFSIKHGNAMIQLADSSMGVPIAEIALNTNRVGMDNSNIYIKLANVVKMLINSSGFQINDKFACNSATPQAAYASGGAVSGTADTTYSSNEVTLINAHTTLLNKIRTALVNNGIMS